MSVTLSRVLQFLIFVLQVSQSHNKMQLRLQLDIHYSLQMVRK